MWFSRNILNDRQTRKFVKHEWAQEDLWPKLEVQNAEEWDRCGITVGYTQTEILFMHELFTVLRYK